MCLKEVAAWLVISHSWLLYSTTPLIVLVCTSTSVGTGSSTRMRKRSNVALDCVLGQESTAIASLKPTGLSSMKLGVLIV